MPFRLTKAGVSTEKACLRAWMVDEEEAVWCRRSGLSSIYMIQMGLRLVQMLGKKLQADEAAHAFLCC